MPYPVVLNAFTCCCVGAIWGHLAMLSTKINQPGHLNSQLYLSVYVRQEHNFMTLDPNLAVGFYKVRSTLLAAQAWETISWIDVFMTKGSRKLSNSISFSQHKM
jgi:hypothetical protein